MPGRITINEDMGIIQIDSWGKISEQDLLHSSEAVMKIKKEHGLTRVLVDATRQTRLPNTLSLYQFGTKLAEEALDMKHAILVSPEAKEDYYFFETVARNRGMDLKIFDSHDAAIAWLID